MTELEDDPNFPLYFELGKTILALGSEIVNPGASIYALHLAIIAAARRSGLGPKDLLANALAALPTGDEWEHELRLVDAAETDVLTRTTTVTERLH
ncbi:MAG TPA: hypothetical protein VFM96_10155 [Gaiellaceae bacterium]|nr:hypothetical protein [Gaiellaceae bacterium]